MGLFTAGSVHEVEQMILPPNKCRALHCTMYVPHMFAYAVLILHLNIFMCIMIEILPSRQHEDPLTLK